MNYERKIYVAFDYDKDIHYYKLLSAWSNNERLNFNFADAQDIITVEDISSDEIIKLKLKERLDNSKAFILLVGESTKYLYKFVRWEIETAIKLQLPIIVVNLNKTRVRDNNNCPAIIRDELAVHISFEMNIIEFSINNWPKTHKMLIENNTKGAYLYPPEQYKQLGL